MLDLQRFSNKALVLRIQLPAGRYDEFIAELSTCAVTLDGDPAGTVDAGAAAEISGTLHVRFLHDEPDLRIETPAVPG